MNQNIQDIIINFPKVRPKLSDQYRKVLKDEYGKNREGQLGYISKLANKLESWMHFQVSKNQLKGKVLEVGAGTLNHLSYETRYQLYDIVEPYAELYQNKHEILNRVNKCYSYLSDIPEDTKYDRVISIATLEHMVDLPNELRQIKRLLKPNGVIEMAIPSEGGALWGLSWRLTTGVSFRLRTGLSYKKIMKHEHVNTENEIIQLIGHYFDDVEVKRFPLNHKHLSFYTYITATL
ncbi:class I SAM-dependent methyltransferase [Vibrio aquaticus]|uniref:class I SAM-dependent methyltransferase n=1 Tax=Vibrio aquaticus TaxID=2496559 RepID=UPI00131A10D7|nr:class I SAM-dependent methyltransferase [Vibrio aquaticus]